MKPNLTPNEIRVLNRIADGMTNKEIAAKTGQSENTVKFHANSLMTKFGVTSRLQVVVSALKQGMLQLVDIMPEVDMVPALTNKDFDELVLSGEQVRMTLKDQRNIKLLVNAPPRPHYDNT